MFLLHNVSMAVSPLAATADELQPWMIAAIAAGALLALIILIVAARKSRHKKGNEIREAMSGAGQTSVAVEDSWDEFKPVTPEASDEAVAPMVPVAPTTTRPTSTSATRATEAKPTGVKDGKKAGGKAAGKKSRGKHAK